MSEIRPRQFNPEAIHEMSQALEHAWARLLTEQPGYGADGSLGARERLALAIFEGEANGIRSPDELVEFALRVFPGFRD